MTSFIAYEVAMQLFIVSLLAVFSFAKTSYNPKQGSDTYACGSHTSTRTVCIGDWYCNVNGEITGPLSIWGGFTCGGNLVYISSIGQACRIADTQADQDFSCPDHCPLITGYSWSTVFGSCCKVDNTEVCDSI